VTTEGSKPPYPMTKEQSRQWLDSVTPEQMTELRKADQATRTPWEPKRRRNRMVEAYRKQRQFVVEDLRKEASLQTVAKRYDLDYGLLVSVLLDDVLLGC